MSYFYPTGAEASQADEAIRIGLRAMKEGASAATQPMTFVRIMFDAGMRGLITSHDAGYILTPEGRAFLNGGQ